MKTSEFDVLKKLNQHVDHFDNYADMGAGNGAPAALVPQKGNPTFGAQFALNNITYAFTVAAGAFTQINFNALPAGSQSALFFFGNSDFQSGYTKAKNLVPLGLGTYGVPFVFGYTSYPTVNVNGTLTVIDATVNALLRAGDVVVPITVRSGGVDYVTLSVHRCQQVEYSTLLQANVSNSFNQKGIRYILQDETTAVLSQYANALFNFSKSWLGKFDSDSTDINSNNQPSNFKKNVIDVPLSMGINKASGICSAVTLAGLGAINVLTITFSTFVSNAINPQK